MARVKNAHAFAFVCKDGLPVAIHCSVPEKFWQALLTALDCLDLGKDPRFRTRDARRQNYEALEKELEPFFAARTRTEWLKRLEANDVPVAPLYDIAEVVGDPQVNHLGLIEEVAHPKAGTLKFVAGPVQYGTLTKEKATPPPQLGEQTTEILSELGYSRTANDELAVKGITKVV